MNKRILLLLALAYLCVVRCQNFTQIGIIKVSHVGFLTLTQLENGQGLSLLISTFDGIPFTTDYTFIIPQIGKYYQNISSVQPNQITNSISWPNKVQKVPPIFSDTYVSVASGFLVPFKSTGALTLASLSNLSVQKLSVDKTDWFYHQVEWIDIDGDGHQDILSARAEKGIFVTGGELVWLKNPGSNNVQGPWQEQVLVKGPDVFFLIYNSSLGNTVIFAAQFFSKELSMYYWSNYTQISKRVIDNTIQGVFDVSLADLNNDGKKELLVTNNVAVTSESGCFAYEIPENLLTGTFQKHVLTIGIETKTFGPGQGAPGFARPLTPSTQVTSKPMILLAGDNSEQAYILYPLSISKNDWSYNRTVILNAPGSNTVGEVVVGDINNDGFNEFFIPCYEYGSIYVYTFGKP